MAYQVTLVDRFKSESMYIKTIRNYVVIDTISTRDRYTIKTNQLVTVKFHDNNSSNDAWGYMVGFILNSISEFNICVVDRNRRCLSIGNAINGRK